MLHSLMLQWQEQSATLSIFRDWLIEFVFKQ